MLFIKGIVIGIGKIIPGLSGSMLAISMGIYQKMIDSINNFFCDAKKNFIFLFKIFLGVIIAIIFFSKIILYFLDQHYIITMFLFIGLIIFSFNDIKKQIIYKNNKIIIMTILVPIVLSFININKEIIIENTLIKFFYYIFVGFIDALTMVVPGISGTATLMMIGAYNELMSTFSNLLVLDKISQNLLIMIPFGIGLIIGVIISVKTISYLFRYYKNNTYNAIIGFSISAVIFMAIKCIKSNYTFVELLFAFIMLVIGFYVSKKINHYMIND